MVMEETVTEVSCRLTFTNTDLVCSFLSRFLSSIVLSIKDSLLSCAMYFHFVLGVPLINGIFRDENLVFLSHILRMESSCFLLESSDDFISCLQRGGRDTEMKMLHPQMV